MDDNQIHDRIEKLVAEEHALWARESSGTADEDDRQRLDSLSPADRDQRAHGPRQARAGAFVG